MRKQKTIKISDKDIIIYELTVKQIRRILDMKDGINDLINFLPEISNLNADGIDEMTPSELEQIWAGFKEVNEVFLSILQETGILKAIRKKFEEIMTIASSRLSSEGTGMSGIMVGASFPPA